MKCKCKVWMMALLVLVAVIAGGHPAEARQMSARRVRQADRIYKVVRDHWDKYGVYPSICIAQGVAESGLGEASRGYNYWGIAQGRRYYSSLKAGTLAYMRVINNGYYKGAPFAKTAYKQLKAICRGGYYGGNAGWYRRHVWSIVKMYDLKKYDRKLKKWLTKHKEGSVRYE